MTAGHRAEHDELRQLVREFLQEKSPCREVRRLIEADGNRDDAVWAQMADQLGLPRCLELSVEYAKVRKQFGRPIGSFQAIKHKCANLLLEVESGQSAVRHASAALAEGHPDASIAATLAYAYCSRAFTHAAKECIQIHGGIGYTWEHDAHLYLRRAKSSALLFGPPARQRARLAEMAGISLTPMTTRHPATSSADPDQAFRAGLRQFLAEHRAGRRPKDPRERFAWTKAWLATLFDNGYAGPAWPREFGGMELPLAQQVIYHEEVARARVPGALGTGVGIAIHEFAVDLLGPAGLLGKSAPQAVQRSRWLHGFLRTRASTIGAGTREIQLNTVAEQVLGLPHDPGMPAR